MSIIDFIEEVAVQTATYWGAPVDNGYGGKTYDDPVEIFCRWDGSTKLITDAKGEQFVCVVEVMVLQELDIDGILYLGNLDDLELSEQDDPSTITNAQRIKQFMKTPLFASDDEFVYMAYL
jgi:hypothetical protein